MTINKTHISEKDLSIKWDISVGSLQNWRIERRGPSYTKIGGAVRYSLEDIAEFENNHKIEILKKKGRAMSKNEIIILEEITDIYPEELCNLSTNQLITLQNQISEKLKEIQKLKEWIDYSIDTKRQHDLFNLKQRRSKRISKNINFKIVSTTPKGVELDQNKIKEIMSSLRNSGDDFFQYINLSYKTNSSKYDGWSKHIREILKNAKSIKTGKKAFFIEEINHKDKEEGSQQ